MSKNPQMSSIHPNYWLTEHAHVDSYQDLALIRPFFVQWLPTLKPSILQATDELLLVFSSHIMTEFAMY